MAAALVRMASGAYLCSCVLIDVLQANCSCSCFLGRQLPSNCKESNGKEEDEKKPHGRSNNASWCTAFGHGPSQYGHAGALHRASALTPLAASLSSSTACLIAASSYVIFGASGFDLDCPKNSLSLRLSVMGNQVHELSKRYSGPDDWILYLTWRLWQECYANESHKCKQDPASKRKPELSFAAVKAHPVIDPISSHHTEDVGGQLNAKTLASLCCFNELGVGLCLCSGRCLDPPPIEDY